MRMPWITPPETEQYGPQPAAQMTAFLSAIDAGTEVANTPFQRAARIAADAYGYLSDDGSALTDAGREQLAKFRAA